jgi:hypothetical protein
MRLEIQSVNADPRNHEVEIELNDPGEWGTYKVEMTPDEARALALRLIRRADQVDP